MMQKVFREHKILLLILAFLLAGITFHKALAVMIFAFTVAIVVEPTYIYMLKAIQKRRYRTGFWSQVILALFLLVITVFMVFIIFTPVFYIYKNMNLVMTSISNIMVFIQNNVDKTIFPVQSIENMLSSTASYLFTVSANIVKSVPRHLVSVLIFYITLFASIKYFRLIKRDIISLVPNHWRKTINHLYFKVYMVLRSFYVVHLFIAVLVFAFALGVFYILGVRNIIFFSLVTAMLQLIPFVGAASMMIGMAVYYLAGQNLIALLTVLLIGFPVLVFIPEMLIRPWLMGRKSKISMAIIMLGILAGMKTLGVFGLLLGPVVLVICQEMFLLVREKYGEVRVTS